MKSKRKLFLFAFLILCCALTFGISMHFSGKGGKTETGNTTDEPLAATCAKYTVTKGSLIKKYNTVVDPSGDGYQWNWSVLNKKDTYCPCDTIQTKSYSKCYDTKTKSTYNATSSCMNTGFKVTLNGNGGTVSGSSTKVFTCNVSSCVYDIPSASKTGSTFKGWSKSSSCSSIAIPPTGGRGTKFTSATTYYACFTSSSSNNTPNKVTVAGWYGCGIYGGGNATTCKKYNVGDTFGGDCNSSKRYDTENACLGKVQTPASDPFKNDNGKDFGNRCALNTAGTGLAGKILYITTCNTTLCKFTKVNGATVTEGQIVRNALGAESNPVCSKTTTRSNTPAPAVVINKPVVVPTDVNDYRYAQEGAGYSGLPVQCGDRIHVTTCDASRDATSTCYVDEINGVKITTTTKVYRQKIGTAEANCPAITRYTLEGKSYTSSDMRTGEAAVACGSQVTFKKSPGLACSGGNEGFCEVEFQGKTVYMARTMFVVDKPECGKTCTNSEAQKEVKDLVDVKVCYKYANNTVESDVKPNDLVECAANYQESNAVEKENNCKSENYKEGSTCSITYAVTCATGAKPSLSATGSLVTADGKGTITLKGFDNGSGVKSYYVSNGNAPTASSNGWVDFDNDNKEARVTMDSAGTYYVWVISDTNNISYPILTKIYDADITTTLADISVKSESGETYSVEPLDDGKVAYEGVTSSDYVRLSNTLKNDSVLAGFDPLSTGYEVSVTSNKIGVYATLTSEDSSYVAGFEPRTVDLEYGRNVILIKIVNNKGKVRTYTIIANREDDRESNNVLTDLTVSAGKISFDSYVSDYTVEVPKNTKEVKINGTLASANSSFVSGYEPRKVSLDNDVTSAVIKTVSQAGIVRSYVITFEKTGTNNDKSLASSTFLGSLSVPGTQLNFDKNVSSYSVSIDYEIDALPIYAFAESNKASVEISQTSGFKVGANLVEITVTNGSKKKIYTLYVNRKEDGLEVGSDTKLNSLTVQDYNIDFKPDVLDYVVKIKQEKTLVITATPNSNRSEVYMLGNNDLTGFSTVRVKVIAEDGNTGIYSIDIQKDAYNKALEITAAIVGGVIVIGAAIIIVVKNKKKKLKDYIEE